MKRIYFLICVLISFWIPNQALAQVEIFYLPESGYLRVESQLIVEPIQDQLSLLLFPNAQITEFWIDGLNHYKLERTAKNTIVNFSVADPAESATLTLTYEGFLSFATSPILFDRDVLWFPEFSFPVKTPLFSFELPADWQIDASAEAGYPSFILSPLQSEHLTQSEMEIQLGERETGLAPSDEFLSRLQIQLNRLTNNINNRNAEEIATLLSPELKKQGLASYLASVPQHFGRITSEFRSLPKSLEDKFQVILNTTGSARFLAELTWRERNSNLVLHAFSLMPLGQEVPKELYQSLESFVRELQQTLRQRNSVELQAYLDVENPRLITNFLVSLDPAPNWEIMYVALEPLSVTIAVPHSNPPALLLNLGLIPGEENWLINVFDVLPTS